ncbi:hypothetical protein [Methanosarcina barkeri]|uniref:hypothetical protein n=1 Tax=Methanosarcina barkeri TaxID=2208 RepID=UPI0009BB6A4E|nr:hypothetical protein [Methanosarcina barkeri]
MCKYEEVNERYFVCCYDRLYVEDSRFLIVEPKFHVSKLSFESTLEIARSVGMEQVSEPKFSFDRAVLLKFASGKRV